MVFFNYATMQMAAKIVYYGPGLCGKTTNLHQVYGRTSPQSRGEMVSLETETDRTLFFDLLPLDVGVIGGFKTRLQLYTVPGQVFYNTTRKLVLKGADGIVFVADSQEAMLDANIQSLKNLKLNLDELGLQLDEMPLVIQLNKRDLPNALPAEKIIEALDPDGRWEHTEAIAVDGTGVFETLKVISKLTLKSLREKMSGGEVEESSEPSTKFMIHGGSKKKTSDQSRDEVDEIDFDQTPPDAVDPRKTVSAPIPESGGVSTVATAPDIEVDTKLDDENDQEEAPKEEPARRVKMRSTVDVMAELEMLRKKATGIGTVAVPSVKKDERTVTRSEMSLEVGSNARKVELMVQVTDDDGNTISETTESFSVDAEEVKKLLVTVGVGLEKK